jgi:HipA-like protein
MRHARVLYKGEEAGILTQTDGGGFEFRYHDEWVLHPARPAISQTLPKTTTTYSSTHLFPFFYHLLPEGSNKKSICFHLHLDENDDFGLLMSVSANDAIGAVQVLKA